jgi:ankyrin repeat protein
VAYNRHACGEEQVSRLLIETGANIEAQDNEGSTALIEATWKGREEAMQLLLEKRANIEAQDYDGCTALITAAMTGSGEAVRLLFSKGANIEAQDSDGCTPLFIATKTKKRRAVQALLESGADFETARSFAIREGRKDIVRFFDLYEEQCGREHQSGVVEGYDIWLKQSEYFSEK